MKDKNQSDIRDKIIKGLNLSFERLLKQKIERDEEFVFFENGRIVKIKARDFAKTYRPKVASSM